MKRYVKSARTQSPNDEDLRNYYTATHKLIDSYDARLSPTITHP